MQQLYIGLKYINNYWACNTGHKQALLIFKSIQLMARLLHYTDWANVPYFLCYMDWVSRSRLATEIPIKGSALRSTQSTSSHKLSTWQLISTFLASTNMHRRSYHFVKQSNIIFVTKLLDHGTKSTDNTQKPLMVCLTHRENPWRLLVLKEPYHSHQRRCSYIVLFSLLELTQQLLPSAHTTIIIFWGLNPRITYVKRGY